MSYKFTKLPVLFERCCKECGAKIKIRDGRNKKFCNVNCYTKFWNRNNKEKLIGYKKWRGLSNKSVKHLDRYIREIEPMVNLIGCTIPELKTWLESKFLPGMVWENHTFKGWHIDHVRPCCAFDLTKPEDQKKCFHYTNLQPLWWKDNLSKSGRHTKMPIRKSA